MALNSGAWASLETSRLARGVDRVEIKAIIPVRDHEIVLAALGADERRVRLRRVYFWDTPGRHLAERGVIVRARHVHDGPDDTVVKLRGTRPTKVAARIRRSSAFSVELDALPGTLLWSAAVHRRLPPSALRDGPSGLRRLLSRDQRAFLGDHARRGTRLDELVPRGPIEVSRMAAARRGQLVVESWVYPDGSRILEVSTKCPPARARRVAAETARFLAAAGVQLGSADLTRTKAAAALGCLSG